MDIEIDCRDPTMIAAELPNGGTPTRNATSTATRTSKTDRKYLRIKAGTVIDISIPGIQRSEEYWEDPDTFNPLRFKHGIAQATTHPMAYIPFSAGPRNCIGAQFALLEARVILAVLLQVSCILALLLGVWLLKCIADFTRISNGSWALTMSTGPRQGSRSILNTACRCGFDTLTPVVCRRIIQLSTACDKQPSPRCSLIRTVATCRHTVHALGSFSLWLSCQCVEESRGH